jgi:putative acyl-CoA dehydrogenase
MLTLRVARSLDAAADESERLFARIATAVAKFWVTRRAPRLIQEAMECLGGAGYVEESVLPRLYRESPLNSIWEGSGNVQCLDVLRAVTREPAVLDALMLQIEAVRGNDAQLDDCVRRIKAGLSGSGIIEAGARRWVEDLALALSAGELIKHAPPAVAQAYCRARLGAERSLEYGGLSADIPLDPLLQRVFATA